MVNVICYKNRISECFSHFENGNKTTHQQCTMTNTAQNINTKAIPYIRTNQMFNFDITTIIQVLWPAKHEK